MATSKRSTGSKKTPRRPRMRADGDSMGPLEVPADALYGASTQRAVINFPFTEGGLDWTLIHAFAKLKHAAATANERLGKLSARNARRRPHTRESCRPPRAMRVESFTYSTVVCE